MNPFKLTLLALGLYAGAYLLLFATWGALLALGKASPEQAQYIAYIHDGLLMLTAHILTILNASPQLPLTGAAPSAPAGAQGGFAMPSMLIALALGSLLLLGGCAGLSVQWVASYSTSDLAASLKMPIAVSAAPAPITMPPFNVPAAVPVSAAPAK